MKNEEEPKNKLQETFFEKKIWSATIGPMASQRIKGTQVEVERARFLKPEPSLSF